MSHWAELDENNIVKRVLKFDDSLMAEEESYQWLLENFGGVWLQTSYNTRAGVHQLGGVPFRKNYAGPSYSYDEERDAFIPVQPFPSWVLDEDTCEWVPPEE